MGAVYIYKTKTGYIGSFKKRQNEQEVDIAQSAKEAEKKIAYLQKMNKFNPSK